MKKSILFYLLLCFVLCNACSQSGTDDPNDPANLPQIVVPLGQMQMTLNGTNILAFRDASGIFSEAVAGYTTEVKFLSIYRSISLTDRRSLNVRATIDLDNVKTPSDIMQNLKITYTTFLNGQRTYDGQAGSTLQFKLIDKQNDIIKAAFNGTLVNPQNANDRVTITDGQLNVQIRRF
jgi:hypothetical protein